jgi:hypothetical protein
LNARCETLHEKPSFKGPLERNQRCLIPVTGFVEYHHLHKETFPFFVQGETDIIYLAGLYNDWRNPENGEVWETFTIITAPADALMVVIHNTKKRMPVIIPERLKDVWLHDDEAVSSFLKTPLVKLHAYVIGKSTMGERSEISLAGIVDPKANHIATWTAEAIVMARIWFELYNECAKREDLELIMPTDEEFKMHILIAKSNGELREDYPEEIPKECPNCSTPFKVPRSGEPCDKCGWPFDPQPGDDQLELF